jgi:beta-galactosidase
VARLGSRRREVPLRDGSHAGTDTKIWREVCELGAATRALAEVQGSTVQSEVAIIVDHEAWWACSLDAHPTVDVRYPDQARAWHAAFTRAGITMDVVPRDADLSRYRVVVAPTLYLVDDATAAALADFAAGGGQLIVTYFSGIVDEHDHIRLGGYPGAFRELLGVRTEEFFPLAEAQTVRLDTGWTASVWTELVHLTGAEAVASYAVGPAGGPLPGVPAVTHRETGAGGAWYVATLLDEAATAALADRVATAAGVNRLAGASRDVEVVRRARPECTYLFVINHGATEAKVEAAGFDLLTGRRHGPVATVPAGAVAVIREDA